MFFVGSLSLFSLTLRLEYNEPSEQLQDLLDKVPCRFIGAQTDCV
jgi:hypothetical protein